MINFKRIIPTLQEKLKVKFPPSSEFTTEEFKRFLDDICLDKGVECKEPRTVARLLDKVTCTCSIIILILRLCV